MNRLKEQVLNIDFFGKEVPSFTLGRKSIAKTWIGACASIFMLTVTLGYGLLKLQLLLERKVTSITSNMTRLEEGTSVALAEAGNLQIALAATSQATGLAITDPRYVRWYTQVWSFEGGKSSIVYYPLHQCTEEEFAAFSQPDSPTTEASVNELQAEGNLFCLD